MHNSKWTTDEAVSFLWFDSAEALAIALGSTDDRQLSAARFAMQSITHLAKDYSWYLHSVKALDKERSRIAMCIDLADLNDNLPEVLERLGIPTYELPPTPELHAAPSRVAPLSNEAQQNLRQHWATEFEIYEAAKAIADEHWR